MNKLTLAIPIYNQLEDCKGILELLRCMTTDKTEWMIIDNGSTDPVEKFVKRTLKPNKLNFIRNKENIGLVKTYQQIHQACETEYLAILHNDVFIYEAGWDQKVIHYFDKVKDLGMAGFFGSQGCLEDGARVQDVHYLGQPAGISNMLEAELHGMRMQEPFIPAAIFDGFALIFRQKMLKEAGGIDQSYHYHHLYDRELSLMSLALGYKNIILGVSCHHLSGMTANRTDYQTWISKKMKIKNFKADAVTHQKNTLIFKNKWKSVLPVYVKNDFSFQKGSFGEWDFKGDKIVNFKFRKK